MSQWTLALSWGNYGGFYVRRTRICLGKLAITFVPKIEIDTMMRCWLWIAETFDPNSAAAGQTQGGSEG